MNSYFEQSAGGFYGSHHHQAGAAGQHHDPATAAYRSFPLGLGMSPYASSQHHHHTSSSLGIHPGSGTNTRPPQDSPYDASVATACKLYSSTPEATGHTTSSYSSSASKDCKQQEQAAAHQNGYAAVMAAAAVKDVWQSATSAANSQSNSVVRPSACTPEGTRVGSYGGLVGGDPASSPGNNGSSRSLTSSWNTCSLNSAASQPVATQLHQQPAANHTFYPWMAIAGEFTFISAPIIITAGMKYSSATFRGEHVVGKASLRCTQLLAGMCHSGTYSWIPCTEISTCSSKCL